MAIRNLLTRKPLLIFALLALLVLATGLACSLLGRARQPEEVQQQLFQGIEYVRDVRTSPRPMVIHIVTVDLKAPGMQVVVTPGDPDAERPLTARTTSDFLKGFNLQLAINGDSFEPWYDLGFLGYAPKTGEPVDVFGLAASKGTIYSQTSDKEPTLYINQGEYASINNDWGVIYNAISGNELILWNGQIVEGLDNGTDPRTAVAVDRSGYKLILIVVDGRQSGYSEGATLAELAEIMQAYGGWAGINLDGGGSSTLVVEDDNGEPLILNSPVHQHRPGNERPVANHLGFRARAIP